MLLRNGHIQTTRPGFAVGGGVAAACRAMWNRAEVYGVYGGPDGYEASASQPVGNLSPAVMVLAPKAGGMALRVVAAGEMTADLVPTRVMAADLVGAGGLAALAALAVAMGAELSGSGDLTATILGQLQAAVAMAGSGDLTGSMAGVATLAAALQGQGGLDAVIAAIGSMRLDVVVTGTGLTLENVAAAVWQAQAQANDVPGSMGALLNAAGAGGDPWAVQLEGTYTAADLLRIMAAVLAGEVEGMEGLSPVFKAVGGTVARVSADVTADGNRPDVVVTP